MTTWTRLEENGFVYAGFVGSELVRVDFGDLEPDGETILHLARVTRDVSIALAGCHVKQFAIGAPGFTSETIATIDDATAELARRDA